MSKVCAICGKKPSFGHNRSHSMVATKRRFNPNLQRVRLLLDVHDPVARGGTGRTIDWPAAADLAARREILLAGGLVLLAGGLVLFGVSLMFLAIGAVTQTVIELAADSAPVPSSACSSRPRWPSPG